MLFPVLDIVDDFIPIWLSPYCLREVNRVADMSAMFGHSVKIVQMLKYSFPREVGRVIKDDMYG